MVLPGCTRGNSMHIARWVRSVVGERSRVSAGVRTYLAKGQRAGVDVVEVDAEEVERQHGAHGVDDAVHGAHLVEVDLMKVKAGHMNRGQARPSTVSLSRTHTQKTQRTNAQMPSHLLQRHPVGGRLRLGQRGEDGHALGAHHGGQPLRAQDHGPDRRQVPVRPVPVVVAMAVVMPMGVVVICGCGIEGEPSEDGRQSGG